jgi:hypothetical protein
VKISDNICVKFSSFEIIGEAAVKNADTFAKKQASIDSKNDNFLTLTGRETHGFIASCYCKNK